MTLTEFLNARLEEDRDRALLLGKKIGEMGQYIEGADRIRLHSAMEMLANRLLRDEMAARQILALHAEAVSVQGDYNEDGSEYWTTRILEELAAIWKDHPDYDKFDPHP